MLASHRHLLAVLVLSAAAARAQLSTWKSINLTFSENEITREPDWMLAANQEDDLAAEYWVTTVFNASATATFNSSAFAVRGWIHPGGPLLSVTLNGESVGLVNTSSNASEVQHIGMLFESNQLDPNATHTLHLEYAWPTASASSEPGQLGISELLVMSQDGLLSPSSGDVSGLRTTSPTSGTSDPTGLTPVDDASTIPITPLPIAWIVQGVAGAVVILPMLFVIVFSVWRHRRRNRFSLELWEKDRDRDRLATEPLFSHVQPLARPPSSCESTRFSAASIVSDLPSMESMQAGALLSLPSSRAMSPAHSLRTLDTRT